MPLNRPNKIIEINISALKKNSIELIRNNNVLCCAASLKAIIKLANEDIIVFIDTGFEINIINEREANNRGLIITRRFRIRVIDINKGSAMMINIIENIIINTGGVGVFKNFIIIENFSYPLILEMLFNIKI